MNKDVTITARIDGELSDRLARLSTMQGRSKSWVVGRALKSFLDAELAFAEAVEEGLTDMRDGRTVAHEDVAARFKARFGTCGK
ncbi:MAG: CopG family transcriptional regulator [Rhodospirillales bacterium]|jgi:predicted transcriptional regulator|nr:CopG family transcriptional regulator [Rhodospirillales bacterium]